MNSGLVFEVEATGFGGMLCVGGRLRESLRRAGFCIEQLICDDAI